MHASSYQLFNQDIIGNSVTWLVNWIEATMPGFLDGISAIIGFVVSNLQSFFLWVNPIVMAVIITLFGFWRVGVGFGFFCIISMLLLFQMALWPETMVTLSLVLASSLVALVIAIPVGVAMARSDRVETLVRPVLDLMQTMPPFVYLIPAAIFFGLGQVPGTISTVIFAMPPAVRLTNLGIRQVSEENVEAGLAFGCTPRQLLTKVQLPLAMPSIMQGVNQTIMLSLSMVVIASMIGAGGLGNTVLTGIERLNVGLGFDGGLGVVLLAIILDRITQTFGNLQRSSGERGGLFSRIKDALTGAGARGAAASPASGDE